MKARRTGGGWLVLAALGLLTSCEAGDTFLGWKGPERTDTRESGIARAEGDTGGTLGWLRQEGGSRAERLHALATDGHGGFVAAGLFGDVAYPNGTGLALARFTPDGRPLWTRVVTNTEDLRALFIGVTPQGRIIVVGHYADHPDLGTGPLPPVPNSGSGLFIAGFSPTGQAEWAHGFIASDLLPGGGRRYHSVIPSAVTLSSQGQLVVVGSFQGTVDFGGGPRSAGPFSLEDNDHPGGFLVRFTPGGQHVWSRSFESQPTSDWATARAVAVDAAGHVLVGGRVNADTNLGDGPLPRAGAFIARYHGTSGALLWKRLIPAPLGEVVALQSSGPHYVFFNANLGGDFTFGGNTYSSGTPEQRSGYTGTVTTSGTEVWLKDLGHLTLRGLVVGAQGTRALTGHGARFDLGGGLLAEDADGDVPFVARFSLTGDHLWSRAFGPALTGGTGHAALQLTQQPAGTLLAGSEFSAPVQLDTRRLTPRGASDLLFFQLQP